MAATMDPARDTKIGPTAHYTAYVWHRLGFPYADLFRTARGARLFWSFRLVGEWAAAASSRIPSMEQYLDLRHRLIEGSLEEHRPDLIIEIGAGLSRRGVTWAADRGVPYVEIDLPHMVRAKRAFLERAPRDVLERVARRLRVEEGDILSPDFESHLKEHLRAERASRPVVIAEGVLGYFDRAERERIVGAVRRAFGEGGEPMFLCDLRTRAAGRSMRGATALLGTAIRIATRGRGARPDFEDDGDVEAFFRQVGFRRTTKLDAKRLPHLAHLRFPSTVWRARP